ncbi:hypothetical protein FRC03_011725 [Tulasnella sp. 419]|nr:hypothetical protein FRC03_011725 [Tulasnella sp. 419]
MFRRSVPPVLLSRLLQEGERSYVFRGHFGKTPIVAKIAAEVQSLISRLSPPRIRNLHSLQGCGIPRCFGLFHLGDFAKVLLMEYCGRSIDSFDDLSPEQSNTLDRVVSVMEQHGVRHDDLEPRNILVSDSGDVFVIDFEMVSSIEPDSFRSTPSQTSE